MHRPARYPWNAIERVPRDALIGMHAVREAFAGAWGRQPIELVLAEVIGEPVRLVGVHLIAASQRLPRARSATCQFKTRSAAGHVWIETEPELALRLASRLLRRPPGMVDPLSPVPDPIQGAIAALALSVARRMAHDDCLALQAFGAAACDGRSRTRPNAIAIDVTLLIADEAYELTVVIDAEARPTRSERKFEREQLVALGGMPLALEVVVGLAQADAALVGSLCAGDVLLAGQGWWVTRSEGGLAGRAILCTAGASRGIPVSLLGEGRIVVLEGTMGVDVDKEAQATNGDPGGSIAEVLAEAPVVVRVELGQVSMTAREWAALRPGDIITTGRRVAERAVLRVAGREVARGELVDVDGELGVRVHELVGQHNGGTS